MVRKKLKRSSAVYKERYKQARQKIETSILKDKPQTEVNIEQAYNRSKFTLGEYVTLDWEHRADIIRLKKIIREYATDSTKKRPLNIIMLAEPGSGKSHFIKCVAKKMDTENISAITFNMANIDRIDDFLQPLESIRNLKVLDRLPILFLDEFDSKPEYYSLLLPLLWDGELHVGHRDLKLGKVIIILAGSGAKIIETMKTSKAMQTKLNLDSPKLADLLSRINGGELKIPSLDLEKNDRNRKVDKICITIALIQQRFGENITAVPWALLRFIANSQFRYGVRSITHLIDLIPKISDDSVELKLKDLNLPLSSVEALKKNSLAYHFISEDGPAEIIRNWDEIRKTDILVRFKSIPEEETAF